MTCSGLLPRRAGSPAEAAWTCGALSFWNGGAPTSGSDLSGGGPAYAFVASSLIAALAGAGMSAASHSALIFSSKGS